MTKIIRYLKNHLYSLYCKLRGAQISDKSCINYRSEITKIKKLRLGRNSIIYKNASIYIGNDGSFTMGNYSHSAPYAYFLVENNSMAIGNDVAIGPYCSFFCSSNSYSKEEPLFRKNYINGDISIGNNVFIGAQSVILPGTVIGNDIIIAANSVVSGTLEDGYMYGGTPCKKLKPLLKND